MTYYVSVLNDNLQLYVRKSNNTNASYMDIGTSGQYIYGINNKGEQANLLLLAKIRLFQKQSKNWNLKRNIMLELEHIEKLVAKRFTVVGVL